MGTAKTPAKLIPGVPGRGKSVKARVTAERIVTGLPWWSWVGFWSRASFLCFQIAHLRSASAQQFLKKTTLGVEGHVYEPPESWGR